MLNGDVNCYLTSGAQPRSESWGGPHLPIPFPLLPSLPHPFPPNPSPLPSPNLPTLPQPPKPPPLKAGGPPPGKF